MYRIPIKQRASPFLNFSQALERTVKDRSQDSSAEYNRRRTRSITRHRTRTNPKRQTCNLMIKHKRGGRSGYRTRSASTRGRHVVAVRYLCGTYAVPMRYSSKSSKNSAKPVKSTKTLNTFYRVPKVYFKNSRGITFSGKSTKSWVPLFCISCIFICDFSGGRQESPGIWGTGKS